MNKGQDQQRELDKMLLDAKQQVKEDKNNIYKSLKTSATFDYIPKDRNNLIKRVS